MSTEWNNLQKYFAMADTVDLDEGMVAYERYNMVMRRLAEKYQFPLDKVCAVFCSLSPNSDYWGNLRSTVSVLQGINEALSAEDIVVSTYGHCKLRAVEYARGTKSFTAETRGPKILNFYHNILAPHSSSWVTIDGHMVGVLIDDRHATMKQLIIRPRQYHVYADLVKQFAFSNLMLPCQMQAILWFVRKRIANAVYDPQGDLFGSANDMWKTARDVDTITPYTKRDAKLMQALHGDDAERADARDKLLGTLPLEGGECREVRESKKARRSSAKSAKL